MGFSPDLGFDLPLLDGDVYDRVNQGGTRLRSVQLRGQFWSSIRAIAARSLAAEEANRAFAAIHVMAKGDLREAFRQEAHFFAVITNLTAAAEALMLASYVVKRGYERDALTTQELRRGIAYMREQVQRARATQPLGDVLVNRTDPDECQTSKSLFDLRDFILHRGQLPRNFNLSDAQVTIPSNPKDSADLWMHQLEYGPKTLEPFLYWLQDLMGQALPRMADALEALPIE